MLYQRACRAMRSLVTSLGDMEGVTALDHWDFIIRFQYRRKTCWLAVECDARVAERASGLAPGGSHAVVAFSGLLWCAVNDPRLPHGLSADVRQRTVTVILRGMSDGTPSPLCLAPSLAHSAGVPSPYYPVHYTPTSVSSRAQQVLAWLVRRDPRVVLRRAEGLCVNGPRRAYSPPVVRGYVVQVCDTQQCYLHEPPGPVPVQVVCTCGTEIAQPWQWAYAGLDWGAAADYRYTTPPEMDD